MRYAVGLVLAIAGFIVLLLCAPSCDGYEDDVLATARACPSATGAAPASVGQACTLQVERTNDGEECRAVVECAGKAIYGSTPQLGYHLCGLVATPQGTALVGIDTDRRFSRSEPTLHFDERTGEISLTSEKAPDWSLHVSMASR